MNNNKKSRGIDRKNRGIGLLIVIFFTLAFVIFELINYYNFRFPMLDFGLYNRHMWSMVRFDFSENPLKGFNLLGDHSHFILILLAPIYVLFQTPVTLIVVQAVVIGLSGYPIYLIAKKYFRKEVTASLWLIPYYLYFGFYAALAYPFHVSPLATLPLAWALYFLLNKDYKKLCLALAFLLLIKEDMALVIIMFALYITVFHRQYLLGLILAVVSLLYFVFATKYWLPLVSDHKFIYSKTAGLGNSIWEIFLNIFRKPIFFIKNIFLPSIKLKNIGFMLTSFSFFPLIGLEILILLTPLWLGRFLSVQPWRWSCIMHYSANQAPILAVAAIIGVYRIGTITKRRLNSQILYLTAGILTIVLSLFVHASLEKPPILKFFQKQNYMVNPTEQAAYRAIKMIPPDASVAAQSAFPQLSSRKEIYTLPTDLSKNRPDYILLAPEGLDRWPFKSSQDVRDYADEAIEKYHYQEDLNQNGILLLKKVS